MIREMYGDIFKTECQTLVNPVNCVGIMGKGLALQFRERFPNTFTEYRNACSDGRLKPGNVLLTREADKQILCLPTKNDWREPSDIVLISRGLVKLFDNWQRMKITSIAFPQIGCGCGGLRWDDIKPLIEVAMENIPIVTELWTYMKEDANAC